LDESSGCPVKNRQSGLASGWRQATRNEREGVRRSLATKLHAPLRSSMHCGLNENCGEVRSSAKLRAPVSATAAASYSRAHTGLVSGPRCPRRWRPARPPGGPAAPRRSLRPRLLGRLPGAFKYRGGLARMSSFRETRYVQKKPSPLARIAFLRPAKGRRSGLATCGEGARSSSTVDSAETAHTVAVAGSVATAGSVAVAGSAATAGSVAVAGSVATAGSVAVAGSAATAGSVAVAGSVATAGSVAVAGSVATVFSVGIRACIGCLVCVGCRRCVGCVGCIDCVGCVGCVGLRGAVGQRGVRA
jgi:hypothetical protein